MIRWLLVSITLVTGSVVYADDDCLECHNVAERSQAEATQVDLATLIGSVHNDLACVDCHRIDAAREHKGASMVFCGECHQSEMDSYNQSPHMLEREDGYDELPDCATCHGGHDVRAIDDPRSRTYHINSVQICIGCHEDTQLKARHEKMPEPEMIKAYENSIHGLALMGRGNMQAPACVDCHGSHSTLPADDPHSPVYKPHISATCGQCHSIIAETYDQSMHGVALAEGIMESPTCVDCHGEHNIVPPDDPESSVYATNVSKTCSHCHAEEEFVARFGLKADRIATFKESFHGVANELEDTRAANCASCHGVHDIYPQSDVRSSIHPDNIEATCGECHEGLPAEFARGTVHTSSGSRESGGSFYVRQFYIWFISILVACFIAWRILEYKRRVRRID